jgi:[ribosomal protein S5]-alanine N-acetyltransferase
MPSPSFSTDRLLLRPITPEDADLILALFNSPKWLRYIGDRQVHTLEEAETYIRQKMMPQQKRLGYSVYVVSLKSTEQKIGVCTLFARDVLEDVDIGFAFLPEHEGKGYAYEAASETLRIGFDDFGLPKIVAFTMPENEASKKLILKLGFTYQGVFRMPGAAEDNLIYFKLNPYP